MSPFSGIEHYTINIKHYNMGQQPMALLAREKRCERCIYLIQIKYTSYLHTDLQYPAIIILIVNCIKSSESCWKSLDEKLQHNDNDKKIYAIIYVFTDFFLFSCFYM